MLSDNIEYELIKERRRSISIQITEDAIVRVKAPKSVPDRVVREFILSKEDWIRKKLREAELKIILRKRSYLDQSKITILGKEYTIDLFDAEAAGRKNEKALIEGDRIELYLNDLSEEHVKDKIIDLAKSMLKEYTKNRIDHYLPLISRAAKELNIDDKGLYYTGLSFKLVKSRWGSCSSKKHLNFNIKLALAPLPILDYVIVHEMCHLIYLDHSQGFWKMVGSVYPDWKNARKHLNDSGWQYEF